MFATANEADIIFNRANVALAKSQRLVASWLPPRTDEELRNAKSLEEIEQEEEEMFKPMPELLGLGATVPKDDEVKRQDLSSNDRLRKQLLGRDIAKLYGKKGVGGKAGVEMTKAESKPRPTSTKVVLREVDDDHDDEDECGRSSLGRLKRKRDVMKQETEDDSDPEGVEKRGEERVKSEIGRGVKKSGTFLDEVLAEKRQKKARKKRRKRTPPRFPLCSPVQK